MQFDPVIFNKRRRRWLSLTSLIDVVFLLLIFFMLTTSFSHQRMMALDVPAQQSEGKGSWQGGALIRIQRSGQIDINGRPVPLDQVALQAQRLLQRRADTRFIVRPESGLNLQEVVRVMDQLRAGGAITVSLVR